jgi:hypothetical protein
VFVADAIVESGYHRFGTLITLKPGDDAVILAAGSRAASNASLTRTVEAGGRGAVDRSLMARPTLPAVDRKPIPVAPGEAATRLRRALADGARQIRNSRLLN